jgi:hypothetical protein
VSDWVDLECELAGLDELGSDPDLLQGGRSMAKARAYWRGYAKANPEKFREKDRRYRARKAARRA